MKTTKKDAPLTANRIRRILNLESELLRRTKKDAKKFLAVPRFPDLNKGEMLYEVILPQMAKYFSGLDEDPVRFFNDRERMLMIYTAIRAGGLRAVIERHKQLLAGTMLDSALKTMEERGLGNPASVRQLLPQMRRNVEEKIQKLQAVVPDEEHAILSLMKDIEDSIFRRCKK